MKFRAFSATIANYSSVTTTFSTLSPWRIAPAIFRLSSTTRPTLKVLGKGDNLSDWISLKGEDQLSKLLEIGPPQPGGRKHTSDVPTSLRAQDEPSGVGSCSKLTEVIQTDVSFGISFEREVALPDVRSPSG